jgi:putative hemolysin
VSGLPVRFLLVILIVGLNAFFAAAEVSLLSVRQSRLRQMAEDGVVGAQAALSLLANPGRLLSVTQVGVTLASLGLGWAGEQTVHQVLLGALRPVETPATSAFLHGFSFVLSFLVITYFHVVVGEVVPKNIAIDKADRLAVVVAPALLVFGRISAPFVLVLERSSDILSRALGVRGGHSGGGHSAEELKLIVSSSRTLGHLPERQEDIIHRVLDLDAIVVREVMTPRKDIRAVPAGASLDQVLRIMIEEGHSRYPVYDGAPERIIGILHYKDILPLWWERREEMRAGRPARPFRLERLIRKHEVVPETKQLIQMLEDLRGGGPHVAMVVDEFGTITGMLTMEDVLEQIVGPIEDEHDEKTVRPAQAAPVVELDGATRILDLEGEHGIEIDAEAGFETLAGFILYRLGAIPKAGDSFEHQERRYTVLAMDRNRIAKVRIERLAAPETAPPG